MQLLAALRMRLFMQVHKGEPRWHAAIAVLAGLALYMTLPSKLIVGPLWLAPVLILAIMIPLNVIAPHHYRESMLQRGWSIATVAILNAFNIGTIIQLLIRIVSPHPHKEVSGEVLLFAAVEIWLTNIIVYGLWYWEIDGGGPRARLQADDDRSVTRADFLFPQLAVAPDLRDKFKWRPHVIDYIFLAFNTATAFSPTDTFPLTPLGKVLMMAESLTSLVTIAVIAARAINIVGG